MGTSNQKAQQKVQSHDYGSEDSSERMGDESDPMYDDEEEPESPRLRGWNSKNEVSIRFVQKHLEEQRHQEKGRQKEILGSMIDNYRLQALIGGKGKYVDVYQCTNVLTNLNFCMKAFLPQNPQEAIEITKRYKEEASMLEKLEHHLTLKLIDQSDSSLFVEPSGRKRLVMYIVTEFCPNGTLQELLYFNGKPFDESIARYLFKQLLEMIQIVHDHGLVHRDIDPENIVFDSNFNPKLVDFDWAISKDGRDGSGKCKSRKGTCASFPPEVFSEEGYIGESADLFALGVLLYRMITHKLPFKEVKVIESENEYFYTNQEAFWELQNQSFHEVFSADFKEIINKMLAFDPQQRPSIPEIMEFAWMNGKTANTQEYMAEMSSRKQNVDYIRWQKASKEKKNWNQFLQESPLRAANLIASKSP